MPVFTYKALTPAGEPRDGRMEARDAKAVIRHLQGQGLLPVEARPDGAAARGRAKAPLRDLALAVREMAMLLSAGQTIEQALALMASTAGPASLRPRLAAALERLRGGGGLADALETDGGFPPVVVAMVRAGEASGQLETVMAELADLLDRAVKLRDQLGSALAYPTILVIASVCAVTLLLTLVVPQFEPMFAGARQAPPWSTQVVLAASQALREHGTELLVSALVLLLAVPAVLRRFAPPGWWEGAALRLPGVGPLLAAASTARFARTLSVLLASGVALPTALTLAGAVPGLRRFAATADAMRAGVAEGHGLAASLPPGAPLPPVAVQLLRVAEEGGRLDAVLRHLADLLDAKVELAVKRLLTVLEPAIILLLSALIGGIVVSILVAVVSINELAF
ncbi:type II secretion system F family protein [Azospirillum sp.]|uniref:type II secretion system F family protein n=1 Tax=Azospirillum sp. TaxID=34012 RepID=UPI002D62C0DE|nr:type II secretion system F family protein [Azospirillum sp.]HYD69056.1 type II secretion system F family protein [Azospirillum sp.]